MSLWLLGLLWLGQQHTVPATSPAHKPVAHAAQPAHHKSRKPAHKPAARAAGISPARATAIQQALVGQGYLSDTSGHWDAASAAAMKKYQADHHWQTRFVPDARALIALGLGPHPQPPGAS